MQFVRQMGSGLLYGLVSVALVVGGLSLALAESYIVPHPTVTPSLPAVPPTPTATSSTPGEPASAPVPTQTPPLINCPPPAGWVLIIVQPGDTLASIAAKYGSSSEGLAAANCLLTQSLAPGYNLYVPNAPTASISCGPSPGWIYGYVVQSGDTLSQIAVLYDTTVGDLESANCRSGSEIFVGERLWVPAIAPGLTLIPDFGTPTEIPTEPLTSTPLPFTATVIPTATATSTLSLYMPEAATATITAFPTGTP